MLSVAMGEPQLEKRLKWHSARHSREDSGCSPDAVPNTPGSLCSRWGIAGRPLEGWIWPAPTKSGHLNNSSLKKQHARAFRTLNEKAETRLDPGASRFQPPS
jgi:hypothetical protein